MLSASPWQQVLIGMGGNIGDTVSIFKQVLQRLSSTSSIRQLSYSHFYSTTPVSSIAQSDFVNAVCKFETSLNPDALFDLLQSIEEELGKQPKSKEAPRIIDLDILFFGQECFQSSRLTIPHPQWKERLFVLIPLADLVDDVCFKNPENSGDLICIHLKTYLEQFCSVHGERVIRLNV